MRWLCRIHVLLRTLCTYLDDGGRLLRSKLPHQIGRYLRAHLHKCRRTCISWVCRQNIMLQLLSVHKQTVGSCMMCPSHAVMQQLNLLPCCCNVGTAVTSQQHISCQLTFSTSSPVFLLPMSSTSLAAPPGPIFCTIASVFSGPSCAAESAVLFRPDGKVQDNAYKLKRLSTRSIEALDLQHQHSNVTMLNSVCTLHANNQLYASNWIHAACSAPQYLAASNGTRGD